MSQGPPPLPPHQSSLDRDDLYAAPPRRPSGMPVWAVTLVGFGCAAAGVVIGLVLGIIIGSDLGTMLTGPEGIEVSVDCPDEAVVGRPIEIIATVRNTADEAQELDGIDIYHSYLEHFEVIGIDPRPTRTDDVFDMTCYYFHLPLPPGESTTVRFELRPTRSGWASGDLDTCINSEFDYITTALRTHVRRR